MDGYVSYRKRMRIIAIASIVLAVILGAVLLFLLSGYRDRENEKKEELHKLDAELYEEIKKNNILYGEDISDEDRQVLEKMKNYDFYQKIEEKLDTYVAFFGTETVRKMKNDSNNWVAKFFPAMRSEFSYARGINCGSKGSDALYGYVALNTSALQYTEYYDLAVVCYGAHDDPATFATYYDGLLRSIRNQNEKCEIYCIIEASADGYNENADTVRQICALYDGVCIDMNEYFIENGIDYSMTLDGIVPNAYGDIEYLNALMNTIEENLKNGRRVRGEGRVNLSTTRLFDNYNFVSVSKMKRTGDTVFEFTASGKMATLVYKINELNGGNTKIYVNGKKVSTCDTRIGGSDELGVFSISMNMNGMNRIRIETETEKNANNIYGIAMSGAK